MNLGSENSLFVEVQRGKIKEGDENIYGVQNLSLIENVVEILIEH